MKIDRLISNSINFCRNKCYSCNQLGDGKLKITYHLSIPCWVNDLDLIKSNNISIRYLPNHKKIIGSYNVDINNVSQGYPRVSNNKRVGVSQEYDIKNWVIIPNFDITHFISTEREIIFREIKSNITLQKIGMLSKQWEDENNGKYHIKNEVNYGVSKFDHLIDKEYNSTKLSVEF